MSKQKGVIKLEGNLGGISFYVSDGVHLARVAGGPSKDRIAKDPAFKRTRENNVEFGGSAKAAKALRLSLGGTLQTMAGNRLVSRLTAIFKSINLKASGTRGERPILLSQYKEMLKNTEFNRKVSFGTVFSAPYTASHNTDRNQGEISIPAFSADAFVNAPSGATHFRLVSVLGVVSDYEFDPGTGSYEPIDGTLNTLGAVNYGAMLQLTGNVPAQTLTVDLAGSPTMNGDVSVIQCLGIEFFQMVGGQPYLLAQDNAMKIVNVF
jgi:hypothetical protein